MCFECLRFSLRLSLSVNGRMTCVWPNCHSAVQKFFCVFFLLKMAEWQFGQTFQNKNIYIFECEWRNGNLNDLCMVKLPFKHKRKQVAFQ